MAWYYVSNDVIVQWCRSLREARKALRAWRYRRPAKIGKLCDPSWKDPSDAL